MMDYLLFKDMGTTARPLDFRHHQRGQYFVFEGPDLAGKSTLAEKIYERYQGIYPLVLTQQPSKPPHDNVFAKVARSIYTQGDIKIAARDCLISFDLEMLFGSYEENSPAWNHVLSFEMLLKDAINDTMNADQLPKLLQMAMLLDRYTHYKDYLIPWLKEGKMIISDRSLFSGLAYYRSEGGDWAWLFSMHTTLMGENFFFPDKIFYLKLSVEEFRERKLKRGGHEDIFEREDKFLKSKEAYEYLLPQFFKNVIEINADQSEDKVMSDVIQHLLPHDNC